VGGLSIPPILPGGMVPPSITRTQYGEGFYQIYFQRPGVADAEFARDIPTSFRRLLVGASGDNPPNRQPRPLVIPDGMGLLDLMPESPILPAWLTEEDIHAYAEDFALHGKKAFTGAFNWYRNIERNNELLARFRRRGIDVPALYVVGDRDMITALRGPGREDISLSAVLRGEGGPGSSLSAVAPRHGPAVLSGCGHWTQQERPAEVNAALVDFLARIDGSAPR
jgi:epoxide hydrolase A/B